MIEAQYTSKVHERLPQDVYHWKINDSFEGGVPDAMYMHAPVDGEDPSGITLWVEYKLIKALPVRDTTIVIPNLSKLQEVWLKRAERAGHKALVVVGVERKLIGRCSAGVVLSVEEAITGVEAGKLRKKLLDYRGVGAVLSKAVKGYIDLT